MRPEMNPITTAALELSDADLLAHITTLMALRGVYDTNCAGAYGEALAIACYGLIKAPCGTKGFDGYINGRRVAVKTRTPSPSKRQHVEVDHPDATDDLMVIHLHDDGTHDMYRAPIANIKSSQRPRGARRYTLGNIRKATT